MKPYLFLLRVLPFVAALFITVFFCYANSLVASNDFAAYSTEQIFKSMWQGQLISVPLLLFPTLVFLFCNGFKATLKSWFSVPTCSFRVGLLLFFVLLCCCNALLCVVAPAEDQTSIALFAQLRGGHCFVIALFICAIVPFVEELLFRGVVMNALPTMPAVCVSAVLFALAHGFNAYLLPICFVGWMLALLRHRTQSLWLPIGCHAAFNTISLLTTLLAV